MANVVASAEEISGGALSPTNLAEVVQQVAARGYVRPPFTVALC
jgi:hypothetical protein